jgi:hypothetical protein
MENVEAKLIKQGKHLGVPLETKMATIYVMLNIRWASQGCLHSNCHGSI